MTTERAGYVLHRALVYGCATHPFVQLRDIAAKLDNLGHNRGIEPNSRTVPAILKLLIATGMMNYFSLRDIMPDWCNMI